MSDESEITAEKPVNDGGGNAPTSEPEPDPVPEEEAALGAEKPVNQGGGS